MKIEYTACLTGNRPKGLPWGYNENRNSCKDFKQELKQVFISVIESGVSTFLIGMAEGIDMIGAEILIELRKIHKYIKIVAAIPCKNQEKRWKQSQQKRYWNVLKHCDDKIVLSEECTKECFNERNLWMVQHSKFCIACWNGKPSGTRNTICFARENGCEVKIINLNNFV